MRKSVKNIEKQNSFILSQFSSTFIFYNILFISYSLSELGFSSKESKLYFAAKWFILDLHIEKKKESVSAKCIIMYFAFYCIIQHLYSYMKKHFTYFIVSFTELTLKPGFSRKECKLYFAAKLFYSWNFTMKAERRGSISVKCLTLSFSFHEKIVWTNKLKQVEQSFWTPWISEFSPYQE